VKGEGVKVPEEGKKERAGVRVREACGNRERWRDFKRSRERVPLGNRLRCIGGDIVNVEEAL
jgi:hypothetical protein